MHHLLEIFVWLLAAFVLGWLLGRLLHCLLLRPRDIGEDVRTPADERQSAAPAAQSLVSDASRAAAGSDDSQAADESGPAVSRGLQAAAMHQTATAGEQTDTATSGKDEAEEQRQMSAQGREPADDEASAAARADDKSADDDRPADDDGTQADTRPAEHPVPAHGLAAPLGEPDDLQMISGIGPKLEKLLHDMGVYHFAQIAAWTEKDIAEIDAKLKFKGRIQREEWVRQAQLLAAGKLEQFEREYGTGGKKGADGKSRPGSRTRRST